VSRTGDLYICEPKELRIAASSAALFFCGRTVNKLHGFCTSRTGMFLRRSAPGCIGSHAKSQ
jgi:hypothetical protein